MTSWLQAKNNASSLLAAGIDARQNTLAVKSSEGSRFPSVFPFRVTVENEIMECTNRVDDVLTVTRGVEDTTAAAHVINKAVRLNITASIITQMQGEIDLKIPKSLVDARGDIVTATADNTPARFPLGSDGQLLRARPSEATGLKWEDFPTGVAIITTGTYTGNGTANRAITHGLGSIPKVVFIQNQTDTSYLYHYMIFPGFGYGYILGFRLGSGSWSGQSNIPYLGVTQMDSSYFYVGNSSDSNYMFTANTNNKIYRWVAFA